MPWSFSDASNGYLELAANGLSGVNDSPLSLSAWFQRAAATTHPIVWLSASEPATTDHRVVLNSTAPGQQIQAYFANTASTGSISTPTSTYALDIWNLAIGVFPQGGSGSGYIDECIGYLYNSVLGVLEAGSAGSTERLLTFPLDNIRIGAAANSNTSTFTGYICHVAIWSGVLNSNQRTALISNTPNNTSALNVGTSPATLLAYWPLTSASLADTVAAQTLTAVGGAAYSASPAEPTLSSGASAVINKLSGPFGGPFRKLI